MPLEAIKDYVGAIATILGSLLAACIGAVGAAVVMLFQARSEAKRAHTRIDAQEREFDARLNGLAGDIQRLDARLQERDERIEDKLDRLIERGSGFPPL